MLSPYQFYHSLIYKSWALVTVIFYFINACLWSIVWNIKI